MRTNLLICPDCRRVWRGQWSLRETTARNRGGSTPGKGHGSIPWGEEWDQRVSWIGRTIADIAIGDELLLEQLARFAYTGADLGSVVMTEDQLWSYINAQYSFARLCFGKVKHWHEPTARSMLRLGADWLQLQLYAGVVRAKGALAASRVERAKPRSRQAPRQTTRRRSAP